MWWGGFASGSDVLVTDSVSRTLYLPWVCVAGLTFAPTHRGCGQLMHKQTVACRDKLSLVAVHCHNLHHTFAAGKASAPGRASREILKAWLSGTRLINPHVDLLPIQDYAIAHSPHLPVRRSQTWGRHETRHQTGDPNIRTESKYSPTPLSLLNLSQTSC